MRIGMIGLDTSHVTAFAGMLNNSGHPYHVPGARVVTAYPGGSPDFELSRSRVEGYTAELRDRYGVRMLSSIEEVAESCDAIMLESVDGRVHREQFGRIAVYGKPVFIDKPFALTMEEAAGIAETAARCGVPLMSSSSLRFAEAFRQKLGDSESMGELVGIDVFGPLPLQPLQPGWFWYGIHTAEMVYAALGTGCRKVTARLQESHEAVIAEWEDGRIAQLRGLRSGGGSFGGVIHRSGGSVFFDVGTSAKPFYASLLEQVVGFFQTGQSPVPQEQTLELVRFLEAVNESRERGVSVSIG